MAPERGYKLSLLLLFIGNAQNQTNAVRKIC